MFRLGFEGKGEFGLNYDYYWDLQNYRNSHEHESAPLFNDWQMQIPFARYLSEEKRVLCFASAKSKCVVTIDNCIFQLRQHYALNEGDHTLKLHVISYHGHDDLVVWDVMKHLPANLNKGGAHTEHKVKIARPLKITLQQDDELILTHSLNIQLLDSTWIDIRQDEHCLD